MEREEFFGKIYRRLFNQAPADMKSILVTGGAGYIGSHTMLALTDHGERVVILDDLSAGAPAAPLLPATFIEGNIGDDELVRTIIKEHNIDTVLHFAGSILIDESVREPEKYFKNNTDNTRILAEAAAELNVRNFVYSSSAAVYGTPTHVPVSEEDAIAPISPYGESKARAETILQDFSAQGAFNAVLLRYFNPAGADRKLRSGYRRNKRATHVVPVAVQAALQGRPFTINGTDYDTHDGTCVRDYIHVSDLADVHVHALTYLREGGATRIFNCGDGKGYSVREVLSAIDAETGGSMEILEGPRRSGDPAVLVADSSRIMKETGWKPHFGLQEIVRDELAWTRAQA
jgi:UDP-glucose 4-epimerase